MTITGADGSPMMFGLGLALKDNWEFKSTMPDEKPYFNVTSLLSVSLLTTNI